MKCFGRKCTITIVGLFIFLVAGMLREPLLYSLRPGILGVLVIPLLLTCWFVSKKNWLLALIFSASLLLGCGNELTYYLQKRRVLSADSAVRWQHGRHLIVGFRDPAMIEQLVQSQGVGGIFLTAQNVDHKKPEEIRRWIEKLQRIQKANRLPPLIVACDQEGGGVSRLTPPLALGPALSSFVQGGRVNSETVLEWGREQGRQLRGVGVNMNFSPVVDVPISTEMDSLDRYSQIPARAISEDPRLVAKVATGYSSGLIESGVLPVAKHFPGLGRVKTDTHLFSARLKVPFEQWQESDAIPFQQFKKSKVMAASMLSHVIFDCVDPENPSSLSKRVIELARETMGDQVQLVTDDINMHPTFHRKGGVGKSAQDALEAGVDWVLISYMGETYFPVMDVLLNQK